MDEHRPRWGDDGQSGGNPGSLVKLTEDADDHPGPCADDFSAVMQRARDAGVVSQIVTGGSLKESKQALALCTSGKYGILSMESRSR